MIYYAPNLTVLAYHRVNDLPFDTSKYTVSPKELEEQLTYIKKAFSVITFADVLQMRLTRLSNNKFCIITFDDGYQDNFLNAMPILIKLKIKACFFLTTNLIKDDASSFCKQNSIQSFPGMTWRQVRELREMGFEVGAHTCNHPNLTKISIEKARSEIIESKAKIELALGKPVNIFAYPYGKKHLHYNDSIKKIIGEEFVICCTGMKGRNRLETMDLLEVRRLCVHKKWSLPLFAKKVKRDFDSAFVYNIISKLKLLESFLLCRH